MNIGQQVYVLSPDSRAVYRGVIVGKKWVFGPLPTRLYIVRGIAPGASIADVLKNLFTSTADDLKYYHAAYLSPIYEEPGAESVVQDGEGHSVRVGTEEDKRNLDKLFKAGYRLFKCLECRQWFATVLELPAPQQVCNRLECILKNSRAKQ